jgi:hypothetical protein
MGGYANPCRDEECPLEGRHEAHEPMGPPVTASIGYVSPTYHVEVRDRLQRENARLRAALNRCRDVFLQDAPHTWRHEVEAIESALSEGNEP